MPAIRARRPAHVAAERVGEVALVGVAAMKCDVRQRPRRFPQMSSHFGGVWACIGRDVLTAVSSVTASDSRASAASDERVRHACTNRAASAVEYEASGNGGQFVVVIPALDMTVAVTAGNYGQYGVWRKIREELVPQLMAAVR